MVKNIEIDDKYKVVFNVKMVLALFNAIYKDNKITKEEYDRLIIKINRTFNIKV
ncbi:MAG: hypothetical protein PHN42_05190 [Bacilli bacterium]|nr:hypothetical protein [Bacilli bacterium]